jgi:RNA polymerase sigma-70 factor, ECF subfamily
MPGLSAFIALKGRSLWQRARVTIDPDSDILQGLARGEAEACAVLMKRRLPGILALCQRMLRDDMEAEDVAQETFMKAFQAAINWQPGRARFSTWLYRVAINLCHDRLRYSGRRGVHDELDEASIADTAMSAIDGLLEQERIVAVTAAIDALPARQRLALELIVRQDMAQREAALAMDVSEHALESLLARARRNLRALLTRDFDEVVS